MWDLLVLAKHLLFAAKVCLITGMAGGGPDPAAMFHAERRVRSGLIGGKVAGRPVARQEHREATGTVSSVWIAVSRMPSSFGMILPITGVKQHAVSA